MTRHELYKLLRADGRAYRISGNGHRGAAGYRTASWPAEPIVPHEPGAVLVLLERGCAEYFTEWVSVRLAALESDPIVHQYLRAWGVDPDAALAAYHKRVAAGKEVG